MVKKVKGRFERSIVVGSISHWLGKKADGHTHTHKWTAYLRGLNNEDLPFIKKVVFHLHASFKNPNRTVEVPPYEMSETGWGEFDLGVTIYFTDPNEKPLDLFHLLRLHPPDGIKTKQPVVSETLDVVVFHDPTEAFYNLVKLPDKRPESNASKKLTEQSLTLQEQTEINKIVDGRTKVLADIAKYRDSCKQTEGEVNTTLQAIQQLEKQKILYKKKLEKYQKQQQQQQQQQSIVNNSSETANNNITSTSTPASTSTTMDIDK
ncbi:hypothetical protein DFA_12034 [Cavenderia fasciculata]|uniref:YEATS domain-containing protein n=1 Tax=Cavenderia fasciculata TaxID=261658 RepID=F4QFG3_CACFS|nr:uncharacterized protein DFA_12034 [Cavenderia fasciculata]EGG14264.1 hypothetical protein DFA_12034 [Cavenderia fasciculata]|eukprot:XP_004350973.1 hypothetical protein DFA_12034 [Cavenderia fasciculata]